MEIQPQMNTDKSSVFICIHLWLIPTRLTLRCARKPYSCVAVIHELPPWRVMFCVSPDPQKPNFCKKSHVADILQHSQ